MNQLLLSQIDGLQKDLEAKLRDMKTSDQQELKEDHIVKAKLDSLHQRLQQVVDRVVGYFEKKIKGRRNPHQYFANEIESIKEELMIHKEEVQGSEEEKEEVKNVQEQSVEKFKDLAKIKQRINALQKSQEIEATFQFDEDQVFKTIVKKIEKKREKMTDDPQQWRLLGYQEILDLKSGAKINSMPQISIPSYEAAFQVNRRLYVCGGSQWEMNVKIYLNNLFSQDYYANWKEHARMAVKRNAISLSGLDSFLLAIGGWCDQDLKDVERYSIPEDKWTMLPPLKVGRQRPGTYVLPSLVAFCFCGYTEQEKYINSVQKLQIEKGKQWELVEVDFEPAQTDHMVASVLEDHVILFGGDEYSCFCMYALDFEGNLIQDFSNVKNIPGNMGSGASIVRDGKIYAFGSRKEWNWQWKPRLWAGDEWLII